MAGFVLVNGQKVTKPGFSVKAGAQVSVQEAFFARRFVSRGGFKLEKALLDFDIAVNERICLDIGASTGGFTDCLLQRGAKKVYAIDVGYGEMAWSLRNDPRVILKERCNARYLKPEDIYLPDEEKATFCCMDVSFISALKVLPAALLCLSSPNFDIVVLVKPQFEAGREHVTKSGVILSRQVHLEVLEKFVIGIRKLNLTLANLTFSPIKGPKGNIEFLALLRQADLNSAKEPDITYVVDRAHASQF